MRYQVLIEENITYFLDFNLLFNEEVHLEFQYFSQQMILLRIKSACISHNSCNTQHFEEVD